MTEEEVFVRVREIFQDLFGIEAAAVTRDSSPKTLENWDSMQHLNVVLGLEQAFDLQFEPEDIEHMQSVGAIVTTVRQRLAA